MSFKQAEKFSARSLANPPNNREAIPRAGRQYRQVKVRTDLLLLLLLLLPLLLLLARASLRVTGQFKIQGFGALCWVCSVTVRGLGIGRVERHSTHPPQTKPSVKRCEVVRRFRRVRHMSVAARPTWSQALLVASQSHGVCVL